MAAAHAVKFLLTEQLGRTQRCVQNRNPNLQPILQHARSLSKRVDPTTSCCSLLVHIRATRSSCARLRSGNLKPKGRQSSRIGFVHAHNHLSPLYLFVRVVCIHMHCPSCGGQELLARPTSTRNPQRDTQKFRVQSLRITLGCIGFRG